MIGKPPSKPFSCVSYFHEKNPEAILYPVFSDKRKNNIYARIGFAIQNEGMGRARAMHRSVPFPAVQGDEA
jgi:hypothetical protein